MSKEEIIAKYGKHDGNDETRYAQACSMSQMIDRGVFICFVKLIELEDKGLIKLGVSN